MATVTGPKFGATCDCGIPSGEVLMFDSFSQSYVRRHPGKETRHAGLCRRDRLSLKSELPSFHSRFELWTEKVSCWMFLVKAYGRCLLPYYADPDCILKYFQMDTKGSEAEV